MKCLLPRRLIFIALLLGATTLAAYLTSLALRRHLTYLYTPSELTQAQLHTQAQFRLGGVVEPGSFQRTPGTLQSHFRVTDGHATILVRYQHLLPDLFREGQAIVATGHLEKGCFYAEDVLARHNETYTPRYPQTLQKIAHSNERASWQR